jgi:hypothetical protein
MNTITIREDEGFALLSGVLIKTLKRGGWSAQDIQQVHHEIYLEAAQLARAAEAEIMEEVQAFVCQFGFNEKSLMGLVQTEFAVRGFDLANTLIRRRRALCN